MPTFNLLQVHQYTVKCRETSQGTCNCGVAVKVGDDVLKLSRCPQDIGGDANMLNEAYPMGVWLYKNGPLTPGFRILKSKNSDSKYKASHFNNL